MLENGLIFAKNALLAPSKAGRRLRREVLRNRLDVGKRINTLYGQRTPSLQLPAVQFDVDVVQQ
jgi:hypothetical protein